MHSEEGVIVVEKLTLAAWGNNRLKKGKFEQNLVRIFSSSLVFKQAKTQLKLISIIPKVQPISFEWARSRLNVKFVCFWDEK